jgi:ferric-dicitrate binding protein FerR (iron transport regulator)
MRKTMKPEIERQLMRLLHGELPEEEAASWRSRLASDSELAAAFRRMEAVWSGLALPETPPASREFAGVFWGRLREARSESMLEAWRRAPAWNRALAAAVLAAGIGLGAFAGDAGTTPTIEEALLEESELTLAETYWLALTDSGARLAGEVEE